MNFMPKDKKEWMRLVKNAGLILFGTFILAFGIETFIFRFDLVTGGVSGISIILSKLFNDVELLSGIRVETYSAIVNWILFIIGFFVLGRSFALKTLLSTALYPIALQLARFIVHSSALSSILDFGTYDPKYYGVSLIVAALFGGACIGMGCAFTLLGGGSTGGVDVLALTLSKYIKQIKSSTAFFICDTAIIIVGIFAVDNFILSLLGIASAFVCASSIDKLFLGETSAFIAHVVSDKYDEINRAVITKMSRTTTILDATGGYSGEGKKLVIVTFHMRQYPAFTQIISEIDKNAFVTVHRAHEINGEGWTYGLHNF